MYPPLTPQTSLQLEPTAPEPLPLPAAPAAMPAPPPARGGGVRDFLMQMAPMMLSAFTARKNPHGSAALLQGVVAGQTARAREQMAAVKEQQDRRDALTKFMQQVAADAQQFETPEDAARYLEYAETIAQRIDPSFQPGSLRRSVPVNTAKMARTQAERDRKDAASKVDDLKKLYGENFDTLADSASVLFKGKETPLKALLALAELNLTQGGLPVSTKKPVEPTKPENLSEFEGYLETFAREKGKLGRAALTTAEYEEAKKRYSQSDDDPRLGIIRDLAIASKQNLAQGLPPKVQTRVDARMRAFDAHPVVKRTATMSEAVDFVTHLNPTTTNPADDQALIYAFAKAMDPESVVREGEYATVQKYSQSWAEKFGFDVKRVFSNTAFLTPQARQQMKDTIRTRFDATKGQYDNLRRSYGLQINRITGARDGADYLTDYGGAFPSTPQATAAPPTPSRQVGEIVTRKDGKRFKITGFTPDGKPIGQEVR